MEQITFDCLLNKKILVSVTYFTQDEVLIEQKQFWGTVISSDEKGIVIKLPNGDIASLPPDLRSTAFAQPGEYRLRSTGEIILDPDFLSVWNATRGS